MRKMRSTGLGISVLLFTFVNACIGAAPNDGIPESWRVQYFGADKVDSPQAAATADPDADGAINYQEFLAGTNPMDANSKDQRLVSVSTYSGSARGTNDGTLETATYYAPTKIKKDPQGRLWLLEATPSTFYSSDVGSHRVRVINTNGAVITVAGASEYGMADGVGAAARFQFPADIAFDSKGNAYVTDNQNDRIRRIDTNWVVSTYSGSARGLQNGHVSVARFGLPYGIAIDSQDNIYIGDFDNLVVRKITPDGMVSTFAGTTRGFADGTRLVAQFNTPANLAFDSTGNLWVADWANGAIRKIDTNGYVSTPITGLTYSEQLTIDGQNNMYAYHAINTSGSRRLEKFTPNGQKLWSLNSANGFNDGPIASAIFGHLSCPVEMPGGDLLIADGYNAKLRLIHQGPVPLAVVSPAGGRFTNMISVVMSTPVTNGIIRYTLDGTPPTPNSLPYTVPVILNQSCGIKSAVFVNDVQVSLIEAAEFTRFFDATLIPVITSTVTNISVLLGANVTLQVNATSPVSMKYQWRLNEVDLLGATNASLALSNLATNQAGQYSVVVGNAYGSVTGVVANVAVIVPPCAELPSGVVAWWQGEGSGFDSIGTNHGTIAGGMSFATGKVGQGFNFDGINDAVIASGNSNLNLRSLTIEGWIYPASVSSARPILDITSTNSRVGAHIFIGYPSSGALMANLRDASLTDHALTTSSGMIPANQWTHVAVTYDYTNGAASLFVNGAVVSSGNLGSFIPQTAHNLNLGFRPVNQDNGLAQYFTGRLDEFALYNRALTTNEVRAIYQAGGAGKCGPQMPPLVSAFATPNLVYNVGDSFTINPTVSGTPPFMFQWYLNGQALGNATNLALSVSTATTNHSGEYTLVVTNTYGSTTSLIATIMLQPVSCVPAATGLAGWWRAEGNGIDEAGANAAILNGGIAYSAGKVGQAFDLDGVDDTIVVPASTNYKCTNFTIEGWIYPRTMTRAQPLAEFWPGSTFATHFWLNLNCAADVNNPVAGALMGNIMDSGGGWHFLCSPAGVVAADQWSHVALIYDNATGLGRILVNGAVVATASLGQFVPRTAGPMHIGHRSPYFFNGRFDEFSVYSRALSTNEIQAIYQAGSAGKCGPQVPPAIVPLAQTNLVAALGEAFALAPTISGTPPFAFQWFLNGAMLSNATSPALTLPAASTNDAGEYSLAVSNAYGSVTSVVAQVAVLALPPTITTQPASQTILVGNPASFTVEASGTRPLAYQWYFNDAPVADATNATLFLASVQGTNAGAYQVVVTNTEGAVTSTVATLTVQYPPAQVFVQNTSAASGVAAVVPVFVVANGNENALQFSVSFSTSRATLLEVLPGAGAPNATLLTNASQLGSGRVGVLLSMPPGTTISAGTQEVARISFLLAPQISPTTMTMMFGDQPTARQLVDAQAAVLPANYVGGTMTILPAEYEGDVAPRGATDRRLTVADWTQVGRFVALLDTPTNALEFQRADCAPRSDGGNGVLSITDWVQAGRYAAAMDPLVVAAGPTAAEPPPAGLVRAGLPPKANGETPASQIAIVSGTLIAGQTNRVLVSLTALGNETALGFSLSFDPAVLTFVRGSLVDTSTPTTLNVNSSMAGSGRLAVAVAQPIGSTFEPGSNHLIALDFVVAANARTNVTLNFSDTPLRREVADTQANSLTAAWHNGSLAVALPPIQVLGIADGPGGKTMTFSWPVGANLVLEYKTSLQSTTWITVPATPITLGNVQLLSLPVDGSQKYFRLRAQ